MEFNKVSLTNRQEEDVKPIGIGTIIIFLSMIIIATISAAVLIQTSGVLYNEYHYNVQIEEYTTEDFLLVRTITYNDDLPLTNVTLSIFEHGEGRLLSGPYLVNETGYATLQIPNGYCGYFDIVGNYKDVTQTFTVDTRPHLVKSENQLGSLGIGLIITTFSSILGFLGLGMGWLLRGQTIKKKCLR